MDYHKELEQRKERATAIIGELSYEHLVTSRKVEEAQDRLDAIDRVIGEQEAIIQATAQAQKDFNSYLAVKEGAVTLEQVRQGIEGKPIMTTPKKEET